VIGRWERRLTLVLFVIIAASVVYPIVLILAAALTGDQGPTLANFAEAWQRGRFGSYLVNSLLVTAAVVLISTLFAALAGYAFGTMRFPAATPLFYLLLLGLMVPSEAIVIPLYYDLRSLDLTDSYLSLILPQVAQSMAFGSFWMRSYFRSSSREVVEAARLDGAGHLRIFGSILLPMGRPALLTMVVLIFMWTWNEFLLPLVMIVDETKRTAPLGLAFFKGQHSAETQLLAAAAVLIALPVVIFFLVLQRHFIRGMVEGAVRG